MTGRGSSSPSGDQPETFLAYLEHQAADHAARSRELYDICTKYLFGLNGGGVAITMGIAGALAETVTPWAFAVAVGAFTLGLVAVTVSVLLRWRISMRYAMTAMDLRHDVVAGTAPNDDAGKSPEQASEEWFAFVEKEGHQDELQIVLMTAGFLFFFAGVVAAGISVRGVPVA